jgi:hypothetical protein
MKISRSLIAALAGWVFAAIHLAAQTDGSPPRGQPAATGSIEGRVFDAGRGEYLENALVSVEGTTLETLTDATGGYRLTTVPAGSARLRVFYTGLNPLSVTAAVTAGQTLQRDLTFGAQGREAGGAGKEVVQLGV